MHLAHSVHFVKKNYSIIFQWVYNGIHIYIHLCLYIIKYVLLFCSMIFYISKNMTYCRKIARSVSIDLSRSSDTTWLAFLSNKWFNCLVPMNDTENSMCKMFQSPKKSIPCWVSLNKLGSKVAHLVFLRRCLLRVWRGSAGAYVGITTSHHSCTRYAPASWWSL